MIDISIIIPIKDERDPCLENCLQSLYLQKFEGSFEILVIKGGNRAQARNKGISLAVGGIIAFIDSDCVAPCNWLSDLSTCLKENRSACGVGGVNISPANGSILSKGIDCVFSSYFGSLGSASLYKPSKLTVVNAVACINSGFWTKDIQKARGFDDEFDLCEDTNLSYKVRLSSCFKLILDPRLFVWHYRRDTLKKFAKQFFEYGYGRSRSILTDKRYISKGALLLLFVPLIIVLLTIMPSLLIFTFLSYFFVISLVGLKSASLEKKAELSLIIPFLMITEHVSYELGLFLGFTKGKWKKSLDRSELFKHIKRENSDSRKES